MKLAEFRRLTAHLDGERELLCAGAPVVLLWHDESDCVSIDCESDIFLDAEEEQQAMILWRWQVTGI